jgi:threonine dehydrogenase-like Zn-dependent dehydrogenase
MVEPCAVTFNAMFIRAGGFLPGSCVAVFGAGPIGLTAIALARAAGAATIIAFETLADRRDLARRLGADHVVDPIALAQQGRDVATYIRDVSRGEGIAMGVEAAGATTRTYPVLERAMAVGGKIVQVGIGVGQTPLTLIRLQQGGTSVVGSMGNSGSGIFPSVIRLMAAKRIDLGPMVTGRFPLVEARDAIARTAERRDGKVLVRMA